MMLLQQQVLSLLPQPPRLSKQLLSSLAALLTLNSLCSMLAFQQSRLMNLLEVIA
jgi:hypothetical protein